MAKTDDRMKKIVNHFLEEVQKKYKIENAYLYGSYAKGNSHRWSDIDIAIVSQDFSDDIFQDRLQLMKIAYAVDDRIEPKPFKKEYFDHNDPLVDEIRKNGIRLI